MDSSCSNTCNSGFLEYCENVVKCRSHLYRRTDMERELARTERRVRRVVAWVAERSRQQEARRDEAAGQRMVCARLRDELAMMREYRRLRTQVSTVQCSTVQYSTGGCAPRSRTAGSS